MSDKTPTNIDEKKLTRAYNRMMERAKQNHEEQTHSSLHHAIDIAKDTAVELQELSKEEAERIGDYLRRDLHDIGSYLAEEHNKLESWLRFDLDQIEDNLRELLLNVADKTDVELELLRQHALHSDDYYTAEITGPGSLKCVSCGHEMRFMQPTKIPFCPACGQNKFHRIKG